MRILPAGQSFGMPGIGSGLSHDRIGRCGNTCLRMPCLVALRASNKLCGRRVFVLDSCVFSTCNRIPCCSSMFVIFKSDRPKSALHLVWSGIGWVPNTTELVRLCPARPVVPCSQGRANYRPYHRQWLCHGLKTGGLGLVIVLGYLVS